MYRIRLATGQEHVYPSIQDLTAGVQRGEVTAEAEIYHQRTDRWLSIESHPHYRMAVEGGTATRTSRLKFTRPSSPAATSGVLPTPVAQKPDEGDLEELNRLLVLLDPLPTPAQRADPGPPAVQRPPELTLVRPDPVNPPAPSDSPEPVFGTMLRLEDLEPIPDVEPAQAAADPLEVVRDERIVAEDAEPAEEFAPLIEAEPFAVADVAAPDLGLPVEIHLDEIPVPVEEVESVEDAGELVPVEATAPVAATAWPASLAVAEAAVVPQVTDHDDHSPVALNAPPSSRRLRPMLYVAIAAILAAAVFAFTGGGSDGEQSMVTLASATAPITTAAPVPPVDSTATAPAPAAAVGFPVPPASENGDGGSAASTAPEVVPAPSLLPSAPTIDLPATAAAEVSTGAAASHTSSGAGAELAKSYAGSYGVLGREFAAQMDRAGLVRLFSQTQLTTNDGLAGARRALDAAASAVRQYHVMEGVIEKAYQDSARSLERRGESLQDWITHPTLKESREAADEGTRLIGQIDAVFALLQAQSGRYRMEGSAIRFDNRDAAARYAELQSWITRRLEHWAGQPPSSVPTTVRPLLGGIGLTRLPVSR